MSSEVKESLKDLFKNAFLSSSMFDDSLKVYRKVCRFFCVQVQGQGRIRIRVSIPMEPDPIYFSFVSATLLNKPATETYFRQQLTLSNSETVASAGGAND